MGCKVTGTWDEEDRELWEETVNGTCQADWSSTIKDQTAQWQKTGITQTQVDEFCVKKAVRGSYVNGELRLSRFELDNKNLHRVRCGFWLIEVAIKRALARGFPIPDFDINVQPGDTAFSLAVPRNQWTNAGPILSNIKCEDASISFPLTLHDMFGEGDGEMKLSTYKKKYEMALGWSYDQEIPDSPQTWDARTNQAFFSASGGAVKRGNRSNIYKQAKGNEDLLVATYKPCSMYDMGRYRYNIYAYGHCGWSRRVKELAMLESVALVEDSVCREYVHGLFEPGVDHLPVNEDFSNLAEVLKEAIADEKESREMAARWSHKGREMLTLSCTLDYVEGILRELAALQTFTPIYHPEWSLHTVSRGRLWYKGGVYNRSMKECTKPLFEASPRKHVC
jgi:hypothetical protein